MARLRFPGRPGQRFDRLGVRYGSHEAKKTTDPSLAVVANIHRGLRLFRELVGESDEEEEFEGFTPKEIKEAAKKVAAAYKSERALYGVPDSTDEVSDDELAQTTRLKHAKKRLSSLPAADRTRNREKTLIKKSYKQSPKDLVSSGKSYALIPSRGSNSEPLKKDGRGRPKKHLTSTPLRPPVKFSFNKRHSYGHSNDIPVVRKRGRPSLSEKLKLKKVGIQRKKSQDDDRRSGSKCKSTPKGGKSLDKYKLTLKEDKRRKSLDLNKASTKHNLATKVVKSKKAKVGRPLQNAAGAPQKPRKIGKDAAKHLLAKAKKGQRLQNGTTVSSTPIQRKTFILPSVSSRSSRKIIPNKKFLDGSSFSSVVKRISPHLSADESFETVPQDAEEELPDDDIGIIDGTLSPSYKVPFLCEEERKHKLFEAPLIVEGKRDRKPSLKMRTSTPYAEERWEKHLENQRSIEEKKQALVTSPLGENISSKSGFGGKPGMLPPSPCQQKFEPIRESGPKVRHSKALEREKLKELEREAEATLRSGSWILRKAKLKLNRRTLNISKAAFARSMKVQLKREAKQRRRDRLKRGSKVSTSVNVSTFSLFPNYTSPKSLVDKCETDLPAERKDIHSSPESLSPVTQNSTQQEEASRTPPVIQKAAPEAKITKRRRNRCAVCGDKELKPRGYLGVPTCIECLKFYRRMQQSVQHREYKCQKSGKCKITAAYKRACMACRFKQCQTVYPQEVMKPLDSTSPQSSAKEKPTYSRKSDEDDVDEDEDKSKPIKDVPLVIIEPPPSYRTVDVPPVLSNSTPDLKITVSPTPAKLKSPKLGLSPPSKTAKSPPPKSSSQLARYAPPSNEVKGTTVQQKSLVECDVSTSPEQPVKVRGPRIKHVCRKADVVLGKAPALFPNIPGFCLSALPKQEKAKIVKKTEEEKKDLVDESPAEEIAPQPKDNIVPIRKSPGVKKKSPFTTKLPPGRHGKLGKRATRCKQCEGCLTVDCGTCKECLDKPKFGGRGVMKQACRMRKCQFPQYRKVSSTPFLYPRKVSPMPESSRGSENSEQSESNSVYGTRKIKRSYKFALEDGDWEDSSNYTDNRRNDPSPAPSYRVVDTCNDQTKTGDTEVSSCKNDAKNCGENGSNCGECDNNCSSTQVMEEDDALSDLVYPNTPDSVMSSRSSKSGHEMQIVHNEQCSSNSNVPLNCQFLNVVNSNPRIEERLPKLPRQKSPLTEEDIRVLSVLNKELKEQRFSPKLPNNNVKNLEQLPIEKARKLLFGCHELRKHDKKMTAHFIIDRDNAQKVKKQTRPFDKHVVKPDFKDKYDVKTVWQHGFSLTLTGPACVRTLCFLCGSSGKHELIYCAVCCESYHTFCLEDDEKPHNENVENWCCRRCQYCHVCGMQNNLLMCDKCQNTYHPGCLGPNYPTKPSKKKKIWVCTKCVRCKSCGATTPGAGGTWTYDFSLCHECGNLMDKGNFCPICLKCYADDDWESKMVQCASCESWVHAKCEELSDERYQILSYLPEDVNYICRMCSSRRAPAWEKHLKEEFVGGLNGVFNAITSLKCAQHLMTIDKKDENIETETSASDNTNVESTQNSPTEKHSHNSNPAIVQANPSAEHNPTITSAKSSGEQTVTLNDKKVSISDNIVRTSSAELDESVPNDVPADNSPTVNKTSPVTDSAKLQTADSKNVTCPNTSGDSVSHGSEETLSVGSNVNFCDDSLEEMMEVCPNSSNSKNKESMVAVGVQSDELKVVMDNRAIKPSSGLDILATLANQSPSLNSELPITDNFNKSTPSFEKLYKVSDGNVLTQKLWNQPIGNKLEKGVSDNTRKILMETLLNNAIAKFTPPNNCFKMSSVHFNLTKPPEKEHPQDLESVRSKLNVNSYTTVAEFSDDMIRIIRKALNEQEETTFTKKKANKSVRSVFVKQMERFFPWFNVNKCKLWSHDTNYPEGMLPNAVLPPGDDHTYAQWLDREETVHSPQPSPFKKVTPTPIKKAIPVGVNDESDKDIISYVNMEAGDDIRFCALCVKFGDDDPNDAGRLLYAGQDDWIHINCALWSAEVFEELDGSLQFVPQAIGRGKKLKCVRCDKVGATVGCCTKGCLSNYHFMCARKEKCVFQEDKKVFCYTHRNKCDGQVMRNANFEVLRRTCVDLRNIRNKYSKKQWNSGLNPATLNLIIGSCTVEALGRLSELSDGHNMLHPVTFTSTRVFWSTNDCRKRCVYTCRIIEVKPPVIDTTDMTIRDMTIIHDVNHKDYVPLEELDIPTMYKRAVGLSTSSYDISCSFINTTLDDTSLHDSSILERTMSTTGTISPRHRRHSSSNIGRKSNDNLLSSPRPRTSTIDDIVLKGNSENLNDSTVSVSSTGSDILSQSWPIVKKSPTVGKDFNLSVLSPNTLRMLNIKGESMKPVNKDSTDLGNVPACTPEKTEFGNLTKIVERLNSAARKARGKSVERTPPSHINSETSKFKPPRSSSCPPEDRCVRTSDIAPGKTSELNSCKGFALNSVLEEEQKVLDYSLTEMNSDDKNVFYIINEDGSSVSEEDAIKVASEFIFTQLQNDCSNTAMEIQKDNAKESVDENSFDSGDGDKAQESSKMFTESEQDDKLSKHTIDDEECLMRDVKNTLEKSIDSTADSKESCESQLMNNISHDVITCDESITLLQDSVKNSYVEHITESNLLERPSSNGDINKRISIHIAKPTGILPHVENQNITIHAGKSKEIESADMNVNKSDKPLTVENNSLLENSNEKVTELDVNNSDIAMAAKPSLRNDVSDVSVETSETPFVKDCSDSVNKKLANKEWGCKAVSDITQKAAEYANAAPLTTKMELNAELNGIGEDISPQLSSLSCKTVTQSVQISRPVTMIDSEIEMNNDESICEKTRILKNIVTAQSVTSETLGGGIIHHVGRSSKPRNHLKSVPLKTYPLRRSKDKPVLEQDKSDITTDPVVYSLKVDENKAEIKRNNPPNLQNDCNFLKDKNSQHKEEAGTLACKTQNLKRTRSLTESSWNDDHNRLINKNIDESLGDMESISDKKNEKSIVKSYPLRRTAQRLSDPFVFNKSTKSDSSNKPVKPLAVVMDFSDLETTGISTPCNDGVDSSPTQSGCNTSNSQEIAEKLVQKIKAESLAKSTPGDEGPYKCPKCKRLYRTKSSLEKHLETCDFEVSSEDEEEEDIEDDGNQEKHSDEESQNKTDNDVTTRYPMRRSTVATRLALEGDPLFKQKQSKPHVHDKLPHSDTVSSDCSTKRHLSGDSSNSDLSPISSPPAKRARGRPRKYFSPEAQSNKKSPESKSNSLTCAQSVDNDQKSPKDEIKSEKENCENSDNHMEETTTSLDDCATEKPDTVTLLENFLTATAVDLDSDTTSKSSENSEMPLSCSDEHSVAQMDKSVPVEQSGLNGTTSPKTNDQTTDDSKPIDLTCVSKSDDLSHSKDCDNSTSGSVSPSQHVKNLADEEKPLNLSLPRSCQTSPTGSEQTSPDSKQLTNADKPSFTSIKEKLGCILKKVQVEKSNNVISRSEAESFARACAPSLGKLFQNKKVNEQSDGQSYRCVSSSSSMSKSTEHNLSVARSCESSTVGVNVPLTTQATSTVVTSVTSSNPTAEKILDIVSSSVLPKIFGKETSSEEINNKVLKVQTIERGDGKPAVVRIFVDAQNLKADQLSSCNKNIQMLQTHDVLASTSNTTVSTSLSTVNTTTSVMSSSSHSPTLSLPVLTEQLTSNYCPSTIQNNNAQTHINMLPQPTVSNQSNTNHSNNTSFIPSVAKLHETTMNTVTTGNCVSKNTNSVSSQVDMNRFPSVCPSIQQQHPGIDQLLRRAMEGQHNVLNTDKIPLPNTVPSTLTSSTNTVSFTGSNSIASASSHVRYGYPVTSAVCEKIQRKITNKNSGNKKPRYIRRTPLKPTHRVVHIKKMASGELLLSDMKNAPTGRTIAPKVPLSSTMISGGSDNYLQLGKSTNISALGIRDLLSKTQDLYQNSNTAQGQHTVPSSCSVSSSFTQGLYGYPPVCSHPGSFHNTSLYQTVNNPSLSMTTSSVPSCISSHVVQTSTVSNTASHIVCSNPEKISMIRSLLSHPQYQLGQSTSRPHIVPITPQRFQNDVGKPRITAPRPEMTPEGFYSQLSNILRRPTLANAPSVMKKLIHKPGILNKKRSATSFYHGPPHKKPSWMLSVDKNGIFQGQYDKHVIANQYLSRQQSPVRGKSPRKLISDANSLRKVDHQYVKTKHLGTKSVSPKDSRIKRTKAHASDQRQPGITVAKRQVPEFVQREFDSYVAQTIKNEMLKSKEDTKSTATDLRIGTSPKLKKRAYVRRHVKSVDELKKKKKAKLQRLRDSGSHTLIHSKRAALAVPQPLIEEEVTDSPLSVILEQEERIKNQKPDDHRGADGSHLMYEITSDDGFYCKANSMEDAWNEVLEKVQDARSASRLKQFSFGNVSGVNMFGVNHKAVVYLIEQLYGAHNCHNYRFRYQMYEKDESDEESPENPNGCIRAEPFKSRKPYDMFSFLMSRYRKRPKIEELDGGKSEEVSLKSSRRATSMSLPMAMRFRSLQAHAKEAVGVYRSSIHGRGLFCKRNIDAAEMIIEYAGEIIRSSLTDQREKYYESKGIGCYMFRIDDNEVVDATMHGNAARFINHSCEPSCYSKVINVDGKKHIVIFAMRPIRRGEELTYDYKFPIEDVKIPCTCGSKKCRRYLN